MLQDHRGRGEGRQLAVGLSLLRGEIVTWRMFRIFWSQKEDRAQQKKRHAQDRPRGSKLLEARDLGETFLRRTSANRPSLSMIELVPFGRCTEPSTLSDWNE